MVYVIDISYHILRHKYISDIIYFINISAASEWEQSKQKTSLPEKNYISLEPFWNQNGQSIGL